MNISDLELMFQRAAYFSFSRKKLLFVFPSLVVCGLLTVFCRALAFQAGQWIKLSLAFLPFFLNLGVLLSTGLILIRVYHHEVKKLSVSYRQTVRASLPLLWEMGYLALPLALGYLFLWMVLGIFYLLKAIPKIGDALGLMLSFGPFLLVLGSLALAFVTIAVLFFITPYAALGDKLRKESFQEALIPLRDRLFSSLLLFVVGILPLLLIVGLLSLAAVLTGMTYIQGEHTLSIAIQWFFVMIPFCAVLSPAVVFFFNFAAESCVKLRTV